MYQTEHYKDCQCTREFQPIDVCRSLDFDLGNAVKYILRAPFKHNPREDIQKARDYLVDYLEFHQNPFAYYQTKLSIRAVCALEEYCRNNRVIATLFRYDPDDSEGYATDICVGKELADAYGSLMLKPDQDSIEKTIAILDEKLEELDANESKCSSCKHGYRCC